MGCKLVCGLKCSGGKCMFDWFGNPICRCNTGFQLDDTKTKCDLVCPLECKHGKCIFNWTGNPTCSCNEEYELDETGIKCQQVIDETQELLEYDFAVWKAIYSDIEYSGDETTTIDAVFPLSLFCTHYIFLDQYRVQKVC